MQPFRALIHTHRRLALALLVLAFCIKAAIPTGFMLSPSGDTMLNVTICSDSAGALSQLQLAIPGKGRAGGHTDDANKHGHCPFSSLTHAATSGADGVLLAIALAFILVLGLAPVQRWPFRQIPHLRPPLRGPPTAP